MIKIPKTKSKKTVRKLKQVKTFNGKSGFTVYAHKKTKKEAKAYQKRLQKSKTHLTHVMETPKTSKDYRMGFKWEVWGRAK